jgi:riboflavin transporter FmnP
LKQSRTPKLTGTAILAALVIVFDYTLKYSGFKIPFPWYPNLKFDFTGIPIVLSLLMYGLYSSLTTCLVAGVGIVARSGNLVSAFMKVAAELSTIIGLFVGGVLVSRLDVKSTNIAKLTGSLTGIVFRILIMSAVNLYVLPSVYRVPHSVVVGLLPLIALFNAIQGGITIGFGYFLFNGIRSRLPSWMSTT